MGAMYVSYTALVGALCPHTLHNMGKCHEVPVAAAIAIHSSRETASAGDQVLIYWGKGLCDWWRKRSSGSCTSHKNPYVNVGSGLGLDSVQATSPTCYIPSTGLSHRPITVLLALPTVFREKRKRARGKKPPEMVVCCAGKGCVAVLWDRGSPTTDPRTLRHLLLTPKFCITYPDLWTLHHLLLISEFCATY